MKSLVTFFVFIALMALSISAKAQNVVVKADLEDISYLDRHPIYDYNKLFHLWESFFSPKMHSKMIGHKMKYTRNKL